MIPCEIYSLLICQILMDDRYHFHVEVVITDLIFVWDILNAWKKFKQIHI